MSNPFEAAIKTLGYAQEGLGYWKPNPYPDLGTTWVWHNHEAKNKYDCLRVAQHVLEAAGKVDKAEALLVLGLLEQEWYDTSGEHGESPDPEANEIMRPRIAVIRSYLSALPDEVKK